MTACRIGMWTGINIMVQIRQFRMVMIGVEIKMEGLSVVRLFLYTVPGNQNEE